MYGYCDPAKNVRTRFLIVFVGFVFTSICFLRGSCYIYVICIHSHLLVSNTISISGDVRVV